MIRRRREPVYRTSSGFMLDLDDEQRHLLRRLIGEVRELITSGASDDVKMRRLFPPAYTDDEELDTEYQRLMRDELVASRLSSISMVDEFLAATDGRAMSAVEVEAFASSLNAVRLILGTLLGVADDADEPEGPDFALYQYLSWLVDSAINALMTR
ncbi:MAG: hypothetical protein B7C54_00925 [Acidimicrobiales bacterium mtb01]|nr:DUF2017 family protein [Actinomycetota bacterium]TEX48332.1 MAG: hypothetical protein B7C54_00925 [Acidimicrobiales bacterium mtb01]